MKKPLFTGVCTALVTPFLNGQINYDVLDKLLDRQLDAGIPAIVIAGTTGESATLTDEEKIQLFRHCKEYVKNRCLIIAGTGSNYTEHSIQLSIAAEKAGVDALLAVSPYYNKAAPEGLVKHYLSICNAVSIPVILYNVPSRTGLDIPIGVYKRLSEIPNIAGVKEASSDITKIARIRNACQDDLPIWSGNDDQIVPVMSLGGQGIISVLSNLKPRETIDICQAAQQEDYMKAAQLQCRYLELIDALFCEVNPIPVKAAMKMIGYDCGDYRLPLCEPTPETIRRLQKCLQ